MQFAPWKCPECSYVNPDGKYCYMCQAPNPLVNPENTESILKEVSLILDNNRKKYDTLHQLIRKIQNNYEEVVQKYDLPHNAEVVDLLDEQLFDFDVAAFMWVDDGNLCFFPASEIDAKPASMEPSTTLLQKVALLNEVNKNNPEKQIDPDQLREYYEPSNYEALINLQPVRIPLDNVESYSVLGEMFYQNKVSGGGGGGVNVAGAIIGGVLFGGVGAVIGSRAKVNEVKSELIKHDNRRTVLTIRGEEKQRLRLSFSHAAYRSFLDILPEKDLDVVQELKKQKYIRQQLEGMTDRRTLVEELNDISRLKTNGFLTDPEFDIIKKRLIDGKPNELQK